MKKGYGCAVAEIWWAGFAARKILREYRLKFVGSWASVFDVSRRCGMCTRVTMRRMSESSLEG